MTTINKGIWMWRQVKRIISAGLFGGGAYLLYTGDVQGPVMLFFGALLAGGGLFGALFPSKVNFFGDSGDDAY